MRLRVIISEQDQLMSYTMRVKMKDCQHIFANDLFYSLFKAVEKDDRALELSFTGLWVSGFFADPVINCINNELYNK